MVQLKNAKGQSRQEGTTLKSSLSNAVERFRLSYPALNWNYMKDRTNGEVFYDVGITIQPEDKRGLVGLWRLDSLEASFGAGGYLSGELHTINTMGLYGALQAETPEYRCKRTHVVFRSAYSLTYEPMRQQDNSRELFKAKDVYRRNANFQKQLDKVHKVFRTKVTTTSYGVRDEYRVGADALEMMMECIDDAVSRARLCLCICRQLFN